MARRSRRPSSNAVRATPLDREAARLFINRELSWLEFNGRVLEEARDPAVPLVERLKFLAIVASNLDEFFMVRVAGLKQQITGNVAETAPDGLTAAEQLTAVSQRVHAMVAEQYRIWREEVAPGLAATAGLRLLRPAALTAEQRAVVQSTFTREVWPVLTPLAVDPGHPFPILRNRSLNLAISLQRDKGERGNSRPRQNIVAVVQVPAVLPRLFELPAGPAGSDTAGIPFLRLEDLIAVHVGDLFPGFRVVGCNAFRVTRNFDLSIDEDEADDLLKTIQKELRRRERGNAVRLEIAHDAPPAVVTFLQTALRLDADDVYPIDGPIHLAELMPVTARDELRHWRDEPFSPQIVPPLQEYDDIFSVIAARDVLLHHPYESFEDVVEFISQAADDPAVLAIKQTLYRTSADSPVVQALIRAAENGKQVTAVVELKARFDEAPNIQWARTLEDAGVHVVYGLLGLKTHCKFALVVRREGGSTKRYVHLSTGNYNPSTARLYSDVSYFTARDAFADDAGALFNLLTGYSSPPSWKRFSVAPLALHERVLALIARETTFGSQGRIAAKMNSLVDARVIEALYRASQAGVAIDLVVRGICCLRPGIPGKSDNIRITSVVDRFLEHARLFHFGAGGRDEVYLSSADWMPRNFWRRVEVMFPVDDPTLKERLIQEILGISLADNVKARRLRPDGSYKRVRPAEGQTSVRSQVRFMELARERAQAAPVRPVPVTGSFLVRTNAPLTPRAPGPGTPPPPPGAGPPVTAPPHGPAPPAAA